MRTKGVVLIAIFGLTLFPGAGRASGADAGGALFPVHASVEALPEGNPHTIDLTEGERRWKTQWKISIAPLFASQALDAASSYGLRELNPLLAGGDGGFGMKAAAVKFAVVGALTGFECVFVRKYPKSAKFLAVVNWTAAGATAGFAVHNFALPR